MLYGSGIYIVSKDDMASFLEEVKQQYRDIDWFLPEEFIYRYFDKRDTHKLVFLGNGMLSKEFTNTKLLKFRGKILSLMKQLWIQQDIWLKRAVNIQTIIGKFTEDLEK